MEKTRNGGKTRAKRDRQSKQSSLITSGLSRCRGRQSFAPAQSASTASSWRAQGLAYQEEQLVCELELEKTGLELQKEKLRQTERQLEKCRDLYSDLYNLAPFGFVSLDDRGFIQEANQTVLQLLGLPPSRIAGKSFLACVRSLDIPIFLDHLRRCRSLKQRIITELSLIRGRTTFPVQLASVAFENSEHRIVGYKTAITDLSERVRKEEELRESERRYHSLVQLMPVGIIRYDGLGQCVYVNDRWCQLAGLAREEAMADGWMRALHPLDKEIVLKQLHRTQREKIPFESEYRFLSLDGLTTWVLGTGVPERNSLSRGRGTIAAVLDITARKRAEQALGESEERFRHLYETGMLSIAFFDLEGKITDANDAFLQLFGYAREELRTRKIYWNELTPEEWRARTEVAVNELRTEGFFRCYEKEFFRKDGSRFPVSIGGTLLGESKKEGVAYIMDITERKLAEQQLQEAHTKLEKRVQDRTAELTFANAKLHQEIRERLRLEKQLLEVSETERRRIGQDLHDDLGQQLTGISFLSQALRQQVEEKASVRAQDITNIENLVTRAIRHTRALAHGLASVELEGQELIGALQNLVQQMNQLRHITCSFVCKINRLRIDPAVGGHLYNIAQEAVNNAFKHGRAQKIVVSLSLRKEKLILTVRNDGLSFPKISEEKFGLGLRTMNYRARVIGAHLEVKPGPTEGTVVRCALRAAHLPLSSSRPRLRASPTTPAVRAE